MLSSDIGISNMIADIRKNDFKMLVVRRKLSSIPQSPSSYDFDNDYNTNVANAECYIDYTGDTSTGLFTRENPPVWSDFEQYAENVAVCKDLVTTSEINYNFSCGNQSQNSGQTNWYFDCRENAVMNLPSYSNSITPLQTGYVMAYDVWLTPFKVYTFGLWVDNEGSGLICFKWYGNDNLIIPQVNDATILSEPDMNSRDDLPFLDSFYFTYFSGIISNTCQYQAPLPENFTILPCVMDDKIALNINWYYRNFYTNDTLGNPLACSNSYRDDTMIDGGKEENDILYDGIIKKYYYGEDSVSGEVPEEVFEEQKIFIREIKVLASTLFTGVGTPSLSFNNKNLSFLHSNCVSDCWVKNFDGERIEDVQVNSYGMPTNYNDEYKGTLPKGQFNMPNSEFPRNYVGSTYGTVYNPEDSNGNYVGTYLKTRSNRGGSSANRTSMQIIRPSVATERKALDSEFNTRYYANEDAKEQMVDLCYKDDGYAHVFIIYFDTNNNGNQVAFITYYNPFFRTESNDNSYNLNQWSPYIIVLGGTYGSYDAYNPFSYNGYFGKYTSSTTGYRDTSCQDYCNGSTIQCFPILNDYYTNINIPFCNGLNNDPLPIRVWYCEFPSSNGITNEDEYTQSIAFTSCVENWQVEGYLATSTYLGTFCLTPNDNSRPIDNPMNKNDNGKISQPNEDENRGEGENSKNPDNKGTHDDKEYETKKVPEKSTNILATGLISMYVIDNDNVRKLASDLFSSNIFQQLENGVNKPIDCILRFCECRIAPQVENAEKTIKLGVCDTTAVGQKISKDIRTIDCGSTILSRRNGDYTDCNEKLQIFLPFVGFKDLDGNYLQNKQVFLEYKFNFLNGKCIAYLYVANTYGSEKGIKTLYATYGGDFITTLPIGSSSNIGLLSALTSTAVGLATGNVTFGLANAVGTSVANMLPTMTHTGDFGTNCATMCNTLQPVIFRWRIAHTRPDKNSGKISGESSYKATKISKLSGFIKTINFELTTQPNNITKDEVEKIKQLLNNGVWKK